MNRRYLVTVLRNREWKILKKYIPPTLFIETNLPSVRVIDPSSSEVVNEDAPIALSIYLPGKPLFRIGRQAGALIPLKKRRQTTHYTLVDGYYSTNTLDPSIALYVFQKLPEEYRYFVTQILKQNYAIPCILDEIHPEIFLHIRDRGRCYHWFSWRDGFMYSLVRERNMVNYIRRILQGKGYFIYRSVLEKSNSYGRYAFIDLELMRLPEYGKYASELWEKVLKYLGASNVTIHYAKAMFKLLYATDFRLNLRKYKLQGPPIHSCIDARALPPNLRRLKSEIIDGVKILGTRGQYNIVEPIIMGYKVESTRLIEIQFSDDVNVFIKQILDDALKVDIPDYSSLERLGDLKGIYAKLSVNQALVDMLRFFLANDLTITAIAAERKLKIEPLINAAIAYTDLYSSTKIADIIHSGSCDDVVGKLIGILQKFITDFMDRNVWALIVNYFLYGERQIAPRTIDSSGLNSIMQRIENRLKELLCGEGSSITNEDWRHKVLWSVLLHTFNHHVISVLSKRSHVPVDYLSEVYDFTERNSYVFESASGGIGVIDTVVKYWIEHVQDGIEDLILGFGTCPLGLSEDLIYFAIASTSRSDLLHLSPHEIIDRILSRLGVVCTPQEREESIKLYNAVLGEARRLASLANIDELNLLKEVVKARYAREKTFERFCSTDEITLCIFKNLDRYPLIKDTLTALTARLIEAKSERRRRLENVYITSDIKKLAESVLEDLKKAVASGNPNRLNLFDDKDIILSLIHI